MTKKKPKNYVDPKALREEIRIYQENPNEQMRDELGQMIIDIATRFASRPNFSRYTYKDEFVSEAIARAVAQIHKIDLNHPKCNCFSYITQLCFYVFIAKISKEKRYADLKENLSDKFFDNIEHDEGMNIKKSTTHFNELFYSPEENAIIDKEEEILKNDKQS